MVEINTNLSGDITAGLDKFEAKIKGDVILSGVAAMARVIYDEVKLNASARTTSGNRREKGRPPGTLEKAIYRVFSPEDSKDGTKVYKVSVNKTKAPHWWLVEFGSSRAPAYPYIRPAFSRIHDAIKAGNERMRERLAESGEP
jgi:HK97 gp10 family phage protein